MTIVIQGGEVSYKPFIWVTEISKTVSAFPDYVVVSNDPLGEEPLAYFLSRCIDAYLGAAMTYVRWERCRVVEVGENREIEKASTIPIDLSSGPDSLVLSAAIRSALELYVDLAIVDAHGTSAEHTAQLCRDLIHKHFVGDLELRLKTCDEDYDCRPSYFEVMIRGHAPEVQRKTSQLSAQGIPILQNQTKKYASARRLGSQVDRLVLGPDSFSALAQLSYKLHFLPQKDLPLGKAGVDFLREWCAWLLTTTGVRLAQLAKMAVPESLAVIETCLRDFGGSLEAKNEACPAIGEGVLLAWGVAIVDDVEHRPFGDEILTLRYPIPFIDGLSDPDRLPRRFTNIRLDPAKLAATISSVTSWFPGKSGAEIHVEARAAGTLQKVYNEFLACRIT